MPVSFRERLEATSYLVNREAPVTDSNLKTTANASQGKGGTCNGDSGGPCTSSRDEHHRCRHVVRQNPSARGSTSPTGSTGQPVLAWINDPNRVDAG